MTMKMGSQIEVQVEFICRRCGLAGSTPYIKADSALALAEGEAQISCPRCSYIVEVVTATKEVKAAAKVNYQELFGKVIETAKAEAVRRRDGFVDQ